MATKGRTTFLPIIARELRVAARQHGTFWMRVVAALVAVSFVGGLISMIFMVPMLVKAASGASAASGPAAPAGVTTAMVHFPLVVAAVSVVFYLVINGCLIVWARRRLLSSFREKAGTAVVPSAPPPAIPSTPTPPVIAR